MLRAKHPPSRTNYQKLLKPPLTLVEQSSIFFSTGSTTECSSMYVRVLLVPNIWGEKKKVKYQNPTNKLNLVTHECQVLSDPNKYKFMDTRGLWSVARLHCLECISHRAWHRPAWKAFTDIHKFHVLLQSQLQFIGWYKRDHTLNKEWRLQKCTALTILGNPHSVLRSRWLCSLPWLSRLLSRTSTPTTHGFMGLGYFLIAALITVSQGCLQKEEVRVFESILHWIASNHRILNQDIGCAMWYRLCSW